MRHPARRERGGQVTERGRTESMREMGHEGQRLPHLVRSAPTLAPLASGTASEEQQRQTLEAIHQRCIARVAELDVPVPFTIERFLELLAARRQRPIHLHVQPMPPGLSGYVAHGEDADHVYCDSALDPFGREQVILHEVSHLICGHVAEQADSAMLVQAILPQLPPELVRSVLACARYTTAQEIEAELQATEILRTAESLRRVKAADNTEEAARLQRLNRFYARGGRR